jgi:hypothetical protein
MSPTVAVQFADDAEVVLGGMADVGPFLECMHTCAQATGQQLNLDKVELLRVGAEAGQQDGPVDNAHNLRVVRTATALNLPPAKPQRWTGISRVRRCGNGTIA